MKPASRHPAVADDGKIGARQLKSGDAGAGVQPMGGKGSYDVDDEVFFSGGSGGDPRSGRVVSHGAHGCTVDEASGKRHQVTWNRVLGLKGRKTFAARVIERGLGGSILEREDGSRFYAAGNVPVAEEPDALTLDEFGEDDLLKKAERLFRLWDRIDQRACQTPPVGVPLLWGRHVP